MTCDELRTQLPGFHFAELGAEERREVEAHLVGCAACVGELIAFKRTVELAEQGPRPGERARQSLREAMAVELGLRWRWWERPAAVLLAATSVVVAISVAFQ